MANIVFIYDATFYQTGIICLGTEYSNPVTICLFEANDGKTKTMSEICWKKGCRYQKGVNDVVLVSLLLNLNRFTYYSSDAIVDFEQVKACKQEYSI